MRSVRAITIAVTRGEFRPLAGLSMEIRVTKDRLHGQPTVNLVNLDNSEPIQFFFFDFGPHIRNQHLELLMTLVSTRCSIGGRNPSW